MKEKKIKENKEKDLDSLDFEKPTKNKLKNSTDSGFENNNEKTYGKKNNATPMTVIENQINPTKIKPGDNHYEKENFRSEKEVITIEDKLENNNLKSSNQNNLGSDQEELTQKHLKDKSPIERVKYLFKQHTNHFSIVSKTTKDKEIWLGSKTNPAGFVKLVKKN